MSCAHSQQLNELGTTRLVFAVVLNLTITVAEAAAGLLVGSLALLTDAAHNLNDTASLGISWGARKVAQREADPRRTFGYRRAEVIGAFINLVILVVIALFLGKEPIERYGSPQPVDGTPMMAVAGVALAANVGTVVLLRSGAQESLNIKSAFVQIMADVVVDARDFEAIADIKDTLKGRLADKFDVGHATLEFEREPCGTEKAILPH